MTVEAGDTGGPPPPTTSMSAAARPELTPEPIDDATYVFDETQLRTYNLIVAQADLDLIDQNPSAEMYVPAGMEFEGKSYGPYRMRYKGKSGAWEFPCTLQGSAGPSPKAGKCSIKVDFDVDGNGASFFGLKKLNFHSLNQDASMLRERLAYALFRQMSVAAPRAVHARLMINGKLEGLFAVVEQIDSKFTRARFGEGGEGNVYKEVWPTYADPNVYIAALETNDKHPAVQRMLDFKNAVDAGVDSFARFIDREYMLRYMAVDRVIINDDGVFHFWCEPIAQGNNPGPVGNHNYYWYEAQSADRFWLIPWDLDFAIGGRPDDVIYPEWTADAPCVCAYPMFGTQCPASCDRVVSHLKTWLDDYNAQVDAFIAGPFEQNRVDAELNTWAAQIQSVVTEASGQNGAPTLAAWTLAVRNLKADIASARQNRGRAY
jgi:spore coat protein CotH